jgi:arsenate reductase (thioredoxin)
MNVLFLCVANSARSQLAEVAGQLLIEKQFPGSTVLSAGSNPSGRVHPAALDFLKKNNLPFETLHSKGITEFSDETLNAFNYIITLCEEEVCPTLPSTKAKKLHWGMPDPAKTFATANEESQAFADTYLQISNKIKMLLRDL